MALQAHHERQAAAFVFGQEQVAGHAHVLFGIKDDTGLRAVFPFPCPADLRTWIDLLERHGLGLKEIQEVIAGVDPLPGAREFLDALRAKTQVAILSDTFYEFAMPLMKKLGYPTLMCNALEVSPEGKITGYRMRCDHSKLTTVKALQSCGFETIAAGDSFNDLEMIRASKAGFLFRSTDAIKAANPDLPAFENYEDFLRGICAAL